MRVLRRLAVIGAVLGVGCAKPSPPPKSAVVVPLTPHTLPSAAPVVARAEPVPRSDFVYGRVLDEAGHPLTLGHARVLDVSRHVLEVVKLGSDGSFTLSRPRIPGAIAWLEFTGVNHRQTATLISAETKAAELTVRLGTYAAPQQVRGIDVVSYPENGPQHRVAMTRQADGSYAADVPVTGGFLRYELDGVVGEGRRVNGTASDSYVYDGDGDYMSVLSGAGYTVHVVYDPSKRPRSGVESSIEFTSNDSTNSELQRLSRLVTEYDGQRRGGDSGRPDEALVQRLRTELADLTQSQEPLVRRAALVASLGHAAGDPPSMGPQALAQIEPTDPIWATSECAIVTAIEGAGGVQNNADYVSRFVDQQPVAEPIGCYLFSQLTHVPRVDAERARTAVRLLKTERFAFTRYARMIGELDPDRPLAPGKPVPDFQVTALGGKRTFSPAALRGKVYLIEVWGPWCGPCVAEMPNIHAAFEKYGKSGKRKLHILSIAIDATPEMLAKFRTAPHPMPWEHALPSDREKAALQAIFGSAVPAYTLIDERGTIIATSSELRGPGLERVLSGLGTTPTK